MTQILKVLVGSRAHGLATEQSDYDYRGVFVHPTSQILSLGEKPKTTSWIEGAEDNTSWEIGHFLSLAVQCNPAILEVFAAPVVDSDRGGDGWAMRQLFPYIWEPKKVRDAFIGYGLNQRKKFLDDKDKRACKYAVAYLRTLYQGYLLLDTGQLHVDLSAYPAVLHHLKQWRAGNFTVGEVMEECLHWQKMVEEAARKCSHKPDHAKVNDFLLEVRKDFW